MATVAGFRIAGNLVMVAEFEEFVKDVDYVTEAEKFGGAGVFDFENHEWVLVDSADFRFPFGRHKPPGITRSSRYASFLERRNGIRNTEAQATPHAMGIGTSRKKWGPGVLVGQ